ncbi:MAG: type II toxin-antitoxin system HicA family toxin [Proteobacteria bacterium]|nr:type II toxin-antitoxin system HicA family toxin [Pseudomonadota bacterium]
MKKAKIVRLLKKAGYEEVHGSKHDMFRKDGCPPIAVPRHNEIPEGTARKILKQAGVES